MRQDFSGQNLRGRSFKGQNLEGANFSYADIRSTDFSSANLKGANFSHAKAGLKKRWAIGLTVALWLLLGLSGLFPQYICFLLSSSLEQAVTLNFFPYYKIFIILALVVQLVIFFIVTVYKGFTTGLISGAVVLTVIFVIIVLGAVAGQVVATVVGNGLVGVPFAFGIILGALSAFSAALSIVIIFAFAVTATLAVAVAIAIAVTAVFTLANRIAIAVAAVFALIGSIFIAVFAAVARYVVFTNTPPYVVGFITIAPAIITFSLATAMLGIYIGWSSRTGDKKYAWFRQLSIVIAASGGTSFRGADLTNVDFTSAILKSTDFRKANLTRTCFNKTKKLDHVRTGTTYLQKAQVRQMLVTGRGKNKNFDRFDLRGVNFCGAYLTDASFIGADLSQANLQDANLSRAKLVQTQLDGTDFTGATLTGAYIEDWNITHDTNFTSVRCEYVYMRSPTKENPDPCRKPDNNKEVFADGDFGDFIQPIFDTLDLYHNQGVDPRAIAIAFKQLAENNPDAEVRIVGMEVKGEEKFLLRTKTAATADKSELSAEYFDTYNHLKALPEREIKLLLAEKDSRIRSLETMVVTALERPNFYAETYNNQGDTMPKKESNFNLQGAQFGGGLVNADTVNAHQIGGNITNYTSQQQQNPELVKTILILAANPKTTPRLRLDEEAREINAGLQRARKRELFDLKQRWAVRVQDVYQSLLDFKPQIVHFSGHGAGDDGLELEDETGKVRLVDTVALAKLFELFASNVECIVLNACYSEVQASAIAQHIPYVIGMNKAIGDKAAIKFATGFYSALGSGESIEFAYKLGCSIIQLDGIAEHLTPVLKKK